MTETDKMTETDQTTPDVPPGVASDNGIKRTDDQMREWAAAAGCNYINASDRQLFIDIDTEEQYAQLSRNFSIFKQYFGCEIVPSITPSKSGLPHRHIIMEMTKPLPLIARIALQACLGSDPVRELLSVRRAIDGEENVVIFFERGTA